MTIGISKERLIEIIEDWSPNDRTKVYDKIISQCTELNPWLPIESAPLNRMLRLIHGGQLGTGQTDAILYQESDKQYFTHWQELPADPEFKDKPSYPAKFRFVPADAPVDFSEIRKHKWP